MKITKWMRFALIALSVVMALSLFACGDPEETTTAQKEETSENKTDATTESKGTEATDSEGTEPDKETTDGDVVTTEGDTDATTEGDTETTEGTTESGSETTESGSETTESGSETTDTESESETETTETTEAPCEHVEEVIAAVAATCTEAGLTEGKKCSVCGEILVAQEEIAALGHTEEVVPGKAATCTETGLTEGKKCSVCGEILVAQEEIPAGHTEETVEGKAATCTETGLTEGKKCSVCGEILVAQEEIPATGHTEIERGYMAPTTAEAGWEAHKYCEACGTAWSTEGEALDAVPTIAQLAPTTNKYFGYEEIKGAVVSASVSTQPSADRTYVRFERTAECVDVNYPFMAGNTDVTGKYVIIKYRTDHATGGEFWANTTHNGHEGMVDGVMKPGVANFNASFAPDGEWHIIICDLSKQISKYVLPDENGNYTIQWARIDLLNEKASEGYFDIAYIAFCDDLSKMASITQNGDTELCPHVKADAPTYTEDGDTHYTTCIACGAKVVENHYIASDIVWNAEQELYVGACVCGKELTTDMIYKTQAESNATNVGPNGFTVSKEDGFVRYTASSTPKNADPYIHVLRHNNNVTGQFMVIKYRMVNNGVNNPAGRTWFAGSAASGNTGASGGGDNYVTKYAIIADGEWHTMVVTIPENNTKFTANENGTYTWAYLRMGFEVAAYDGTCYLDIAELAFADNIVAAENYALKNNSNPVYVGNLDKSNCSLNGEVVTESVRGNCQSIVLDLEGKTVNSAADGLVLGGWLCTPGGVASYKIRVTTVDGEAVAEPTLADWALAAANRGDIYTAAGKTFGYSDSCAKGAGLSKAAVDLSAYAGHKINMEVVAITNYGAEIVVAQINNLTVAAAAAAE